MAPKRKRTVATAANASQTNPQLNPQILDAPNALRASPDSDVDTRLAPGPVKEEPGEPLKKRKTPSKAANAKPTAASLAEDDPSKVTPKKVAVTKYQDHDDPEAEGEEEADEEEVKEALSRPPPVNSASLPLPWKGRLGYVCFTSTLTMLQTD